MGEDGIFRSKGWKSLKRITSNDKSEDTMWLCTRDDDEDSETSSVAGVGQSYNDSIASSLNLMPKTLSQIELKDANEKGEEELKEDFEESLQKHIKPMNFFDTVTAVQNENIGAYGDYNTNFKNVFDSYSIDDEEWNKGYQNNTNNDSTCKDSSSSCSDSNYTTDTEHEIQTVTKCPVCNLGIRARNPEIENIAVLFNKMMAHRMKM